MDTTIRINSDIKQQLKLKSVELGVTQKELANRYLLYGLKRDNTPDTITSIEDIEKQLNIKSKNNLENLNSDFEIPEMLKLKEEEDTTKTITQKNINNMLDHNKPDGDTILEELSGLVHSPTQTDSLILKKTAYDRS